MQTNKQAKKQTKKVKDKKRNKKKYRASNWKEYNNALVNRGNITFWIDKDDIADKWYAEPAGKQGAQLLYSDFAIELTIQLGKVFGQKLRQTEGLVRSLFKIMGIDLRVPDYSTLSKRGGSVNVIIPKSEKNENLTFIVDSSGLKVYGEGEWKVRKHGYSKRRTWRKFHIGISEDGEIRAAKLTLNDIADGDVAENLLDQENNPIDKYAGDGAYDKRKVYDACLAKGITTFLIPPQKNAKIWQHRNSSDPPHPRDENLRQIRKTTRKKWKEQSGYHIRSLSENTMFRYKTICGGKLNSRKFKNQKTEFLTNITILNKMFKMGMPASYAVD